MKLSNKFIRKTKLVQIEQAVKKFVGEYRLIFVDDNTLKHTYNDGTTKEMSYADWAAEFITHAHPNQQVLLANTEIGEKEIVDILSKQYKKSGGK